MHQGSNILLLGWQGTLAAAEEPSRTEKKRAAEAFSPWLQAAMCRLQEEASPQRLMWHGRQLPVEQLLTSLLDRLMGIAAASCLRKFSPDGPFHEVDPTQAFGRAPYAHSADRAIQQWALATAIFLNRLSADRERIANWAGMSDLSAVTGLHAASSDIHDTAGATVRIEFADGLRIFYKPRPMSGELLWYDLTRATAEANPECAVTAARVLPGAGDAQGQYGWMEELPNAASGHQLDKAAYWKSAGSLLCHAWVVNMTDLHMANILVTPTGPAVVDAECLATPDLAGTIEDDPVVRLSFEFAATGLLPYDAPSSEFPDISGFLGRAQDVPNLHLPVWRFPDHRPPTVTLGPAMLVDHQNRREESSFITCIPAMADGFLKAAQAIVDVRPQLLQGGGWMDRLASMHGPRIIVRDTLRYGLWLSETLLCGIGLPAIRLTAGYSASDVNSIYRAEKCSVDSLQIPRFFVPAGSRDLAAASTGEVIRGFLNAPVAQPIRSRLASVSFEDLQRKVAPALLWPMLQGSSAALPGPADDCVTI
jgi:hypothetical protein